MVTKPETGEYFR